MPSCIIVKAAPWYSAGGIVEVVLEQNQISSPMGQAPQNTDALACISTTHLYAPIRTYTHCAHGFRVPCCLLPSQRKPNQNVCSVKRHWCKSTSRRHQGDIKSVCCMWQHCTWEFLVDKRRRSRNHSGSQEHTSMDAESGRHHESFNS